MLWRVIEGEVVPTSQELGISQVVWSPIAQGVLTGKYRPGEQPPAGIAGHRRQGRREHDQALDARRRAGPGCSSSSRWPSEAGLSMAALAVAWVLQNDNVATAIIGASRPEQVHDNVAAAGVKLAAGAAGQDRRDPRPGVERDPAKTLDSSPKTREA